MGKLHWGYHTGTLMSRDYGDIIDVVSEEWARKTAIELEEDLMTRGVKLWFASYKDTPEDDFVIVHEGDSTYC